MTTPRIFAVGDLVWTYGRHRGVVMAVLDRGRYTIKHEGVDGTSTEEIWDITPREKDPLVVIKSRVHEQDASSIVTAGELDFKHLTVPLAYDPKGKRHKDGSVCSGHAADGKVCGRAHQWLTDAERERIADGPAVGLDRLQLSRLEATDQDRPIGDHTNVELTARVLARLGSTDAETPRRFLRAMRDLTCGETDEVDLKDLLRTFPLVEGADPGVVVVRSIPFASVCAHHALPFSGHVDVAYIPSKVIVGLSKIPRLVRHMSRRFSVQEGIGELVANALHEHLDALGVIVRITARHSCMALRGAESPGEMRTCCVRGVFANDPSARAEALALIG